MYEFSGAFFDNFDPLLPFESVTAEDYTPVPAVITVTVQEKSRECALNDLTRIGLNSTATSVEAVDYLPAAKATRKRGRGPRLSKRPKPQRQLDDGNEKSVPVKRTGNTQKTRKSHATFIVGGISTCGRHRTPKNLFDV